MNEKRKHPDLWKRLNNIGQSDWIKVAKKLKLDVVSNNSGTSHTINIRDPKNTNLDDVRGVISTVQVNLFKQANEEIFKRFIRFGIDESDMWKALGMLK